LVVLACGITACATDCEFRELSRTSDEHPYVFASDQSPWTVTVDQIGGRVAVRDSGSTYECSLEAPSILRVYAGADEIALRSIEVASDDVFFVAARSCQASRAAIHLGVSASQSTPDERLRELGICSARPTD
jgi:hypothetical protein